MVKEMKKFQTGTASCQGCRQKIFQVGNEKKTKNSTIKPLGRGVATEKRPKNSSIKHICIMCGSHPRCRRPCPLLL